MTAPPTAQPSRRRRLAIAGAIGVSVVAAAIAALPLLADTEAVKRAVERQLSVAAGGEVHYESFSLRYFPPLTARISGAAVRIPGVAEGRIAALQVRIALLPLLFGDVRPAAILIEQPELELRIAPGGPADPVTAYRAALGPVVEALVREARGLSLSIAGGKLDLVYAGERRLSLSQMEATADVSADAIVATASASADWWRAAQGRLKIAPGSLAASANLQLSGLRAAELLNAMFPASGLQLRALSLDAALDAETDGRSTLRAALSASAPQLSLARGARTLDLGALRLELEALRDEQSLSLSFKQLAFGALLPAATGALRAKPDGTAPALELDVPALDLALLREAALALAGDLDAVRSAATPFTAGTARRLKMSAAESDFASLADLQSLRAETALEGVAYSIPAAGMSVKNGSGRMVLADGVLQGSELAGDAGRSSFSAGSLDVQLVPAVSLRGVQAALEADLAETLAITRHLLGRRGEPVVSAIEALQGRASGTLSYQARSKNPLVSVNVARLRASGRYRGVPFPLEISQGMLRYSGEQLAIRALSGSFGRSRLQQGAAEVALGARPAVRSASATAVLALDELYPWLASLDGLRPALEGVTGVSGTAAVRVTRLSGSLAGISSLDFEAAVQPQQLQATVAALATPLVLESGTLHITPRSLRLEQVAASLLDARVTVSGNVEDFAAAARRVRLDVLHNSLGPQAIDWMDKRWGIPAPVMPKAPIELAGVQVEWSGGAEGARRAQGNATLAGGARAEFDFGWQQDSFDLRRLALKDDASDFTLQLKWTPPAVAEIGFNSRLDHRTLERSLARPPAMRALLQGEFRAAIDLRELRRSNATGTLAAEGLDLLPHTGLPLLIERLQLDADGQRLQVRDAALRIAGERLAVSGSLERRAERFVVDAHVSADTLDAAQLLDVLRRGRAPGKSKPGAAWDLPFEGRATIDAGAVTYAGNTRQQVAGTVSLAPNRIVVQLTEAQLCGIALSSTATLTPGNVELSARPAARNQALAQTLPCLAGEHLSIAGNFDFDAELTASGPADALLETLHGSFRFSTRSGRIQHAAALDRTLAVDEVAGRVRTAHEALKAGGLEYEQIVLAGKLDGDRVRLDHAMLESPALGLTASGEIERRKQTLALQGLVAPLDTINRVVKRVPLVGRVFGASLVVIPVSVSGEWRDPQVKVLPAAAIGATLLNLMAATFKAPIELLDPLVGRPQGKP